MDKMKEHVGFNKTKGRSYFSQVLVFLIIVFTTHTAAVGQTTDYNLLQNWMCHPMKTTDTARGQSLDLILQFPDLSTDTIKYAHPTTNTGVDIFYVYPTIDMDTIPGNTAISNINRRYANYVYSLQAGIYGQYGRVFAPYYRQANIGNFILASGPQQADIMDTAYRDIEASFLNYLNKYNGGNKIILIGHSQGAYLMRFLLRRLFDHDLTLRSKLIVAISGGEPNYTAIGSNTGGSLENIETCPPVGSPLECGCLMNWRTWHAGSTVRPLESNSMFLNQSFVDKGFIYQIYDSTLHQESSFDFGYEQKKPITRFITLSADSTKYIGWDGKYAAEFSTHSVPGPGTSYLMIDTIALTGDLRVSAIPKLSKNYHIWDMQFIQGDLLQILPQMISNCNPALSFEENQPETTIHIYPNPSSGIVHVGNENHEIHNIKLYNLQGSFIEEFHTNDFSIANFNPGMYFIIIQTEKSTFIHKIAKQ
jgi:hypothetical protein